MPACLYPNLLAVLGLYQLLVSNSRYNPSEFSFKLIPCRWPPSRDSYYICAVRVPVPLHWRVLVKEIALRVLRCSYYSMGPRYKEILTHYFFLSLIAWVRAKLIGVIEDQLCPDLAAIRI